jgi:protein-tyrosine kinase
MSIIEKALQRMATSPPKGHRNKQRAPTPNSQGLRTSGDERNTLDQALAEAEPALKLDYISLRRNGVIAPDEMASRVSDQFRRIKRPLLANVTGKGGYSAEHGNLIMVTSSVAGEGKTYTAINLALNVARELDYTVLLVDADVIKRRTSELLGIADRPGLVDLLHNDRLQVCDTLLRTDVSHLVVLPAGQCHVYATELLSSHEMRRLVNELSARYSDRIVIFDSPPLLATAEAQVLAEAVGQIVLVVEACRTPPSAVEEAVATLDKSKPIGLVLNKSRQALAADYYGNYYKN